MANCKFCPWVKVIHICIQTGRRTQEQHCGAKRANGIPGFIKKKENVLKCEEGGPPPLLCPGKARSVEHWVQF